MEQTNSVSIRRITLPQHRSGMADQTRAFLTFARAVNSATKGEKWDIVVATSSRLLTASLGAWVSRRSRALLYLDIRDLFTDTLSNVSANTPLKVILPFFKCIERYTFRAANQLNVVSEAFIPHIKNIAPQLNPSILTNGIDEEFLSADFSSTLSTKMPLIIYAGNIGDGQGLHNIIPQVAKKTIRNLSFSNNWRWRAQK